MAVIQFPYGREKLALDIPEERLRGVLVSKLHHDSAGASEVELVRAAMEHPIGTPGLEELARGKKNVVILISDHTRPVPSRAILPPMLEAVRRGSPQARITLLVATGCHRAPTAQELEEKLGSEIAHRERIAVHCCDDDGTGNLVSLGTLPSGGELRVNRLAVEADLLLAEGFIEPHFFAGYSGGRKSVLPGIAARSSVLYNHCAEFIAHEKARTGVLDGNPINRDMLWAAEAVKLAFIVNVVLDAEKKIIYAVAGDARQAHEQGCAFLSGLCHVDAAPADIVISTNGGYPLDQNIYQAVKGMTAAEATVKQGGVIIMLARSQDGHGGERFYHQIADSANLDSTMALFLSRGRAETEADQWQSQIFLRVLQRATVLYLSDAPDDLVRSLHMIPVHSLGEALERAQSILRNPKATITAIPDGVSVIVS
jgi:nickel-dependent lactate racemase